MSACRRKGTMFLTRTFIPSDIARTTPLRISDGPAAVRTRAYQRRHHEPSLRSSLATKLIQTPFALSESNSSASMLVQLRAVGEYAIPRPDGGHRVSNIGSAGLTSDSLNSSCRHKTKFEGVGFILATNLAKPEMTFSQLNQEFCRLRAV